MKLKEAYLIGKNILKKFDIKDYEFDNMSIFEHCFNIDRQKLIINGEENVNYEKYKNYISCINQRASKRPLQYILGSWSFMGLNFKVGEGVLIPREDTEVLVNAILEKIKHIKSPIIFDLCAGSGAVGISIASKRKDATVICLEISNKAFYYLNENIKYNKLKNIKALKEDILSLNTILKYNKKEIQADAIVSNPPYIKSDDLNILQEEVKKEPLIALDGGKDGLRFYKFITSKWTSILKNNGFLAVEIGFNQKKEVYDLFLKNNLKNITTLKDFNGIDRVVIANYNF